MSKKKMLSKSKILALLLCFCLLFEQTGLAQVAGTLDISNHIAAFHNSLVQDKYRPLHLRYLGYDAKSNDFKLLLDKGDFVKEVDSSQKSEVSKESSLLTTNYSLLNQETNKLMEYFFIGLSLPNESFWVNLRPDSENNIIDSELAKTDIGKIMLEADVQLKKDTALYTSPQTTEGKKYWDKLYKKAEELYGYDNITIPTLTRPWIVPGEIIIRETIDEGRGMKDEGRKTTPSAYIYKATLKVMLEEDYLRSPEHHVTSHQNTNNLYQFTDPRAKELNRYSTELIRELIIPKLTKDINNTKRYAKLRQVYYSLILAQWFKNNVSLRGASATKQSFIQRINSGNLYGLTSKTPWSKEAYYKEYRKSFTDGEYSLKEPVQTPLGQTIRSYFSGGVSFNSQSISSAIQTGMVVQGKSNIDFSGLLVSSAINKDIISAVLNGDNLEILLPKEMNIDPAISEDKNKTASSGILKGVKGYMESYWTKKAMDSIGKSLEKFELDESMVIIITKDYQIKYSGSIVIEFRTGRKLSSYEVTDKRFHFVCDELVNRLSAKLLNINQQKKLAEFNMILTTLTQKTLLFAMLKIMSEKEDMTLEQILSEIIFRDFGKWFYLNTREVLESVIKKDFPFIEQKDEINKKINKRINENAGFMLSAKRKYIGKIIEQIDNHGAYFDGFEIFSMPKGGNLPLYFYETRDRTKTRDGKGIVFNAIGAQRLTQYQIERLVWHQIQHIRTESLIKEKGVNIDKLGKIKEFKDLQNRIGKYYNYIGRSRNSSGSYFQLKYKSGFYTQDYTEILSLLKGYQIYLSQRNKGMNIVPLFDEFIGAFIPQDLDFLNEKYLFEITSSSIKNNIVSSGVKKITEIEPIRESRNIQITSKDQLKDLVEEPLLLACQILYDKNIETLATSANIKDTQHELLNDGKHYAYIIINYDSLSKNNREIIDGLISGRQKSEDIKIDKTKNYDGMQAIIISIPITEQTEISEISKKAVNIAFMFKKQAMTWATVYTIEDMRKMYGFPEATIEDFTKDAFITKNYYFDPATNGFYLSKEHFDKVNEPKGLSEEKEELKTESTTISSINTDKGGIDFGAMPIVTQAVNSPQSMAFNPWNNFNTVSSGITSSSLKNALDSSDNEWLQIERMVSSGIMPSPERVRGYLINSCQDEQSIDRELNKVICCIAAITRLEEGNAIVKSKWKELLSLIESNIPASQLQLELKQLAFLPK